MCAWRVREDFQVDFQVFDEASRELSRASEIKIMIGIVNENSNSYFICTLIISFYTEKEGRNI